MIYLNGFTIDINHLIKNMEDYFEKIKNKMDKLNIIKFKNFLTEDDRKTILDMFEKVQTKYSKIAVNAEQENKKESTISYFYGVVDGINHCMKMLNGIEDDYLDGI